MAIRYDIQDLTVQLDAADGVFMPSPNGSFYANSIRVEAGERVIDIGTGSGFLAIFAALRGAHVSATDILPAAIELTRHNAELNGVQLEARVGFLFDAFTGTFDIILANLPNEIVPAAYIERISEERAIGVAGGRGGNQHILSLLAAAPTHMHAHSRLYLAVHTLTDYHATMAAALRHYSPTLVSFAELPAKPFVAQHIDLYRDLNEHGVIRIVRRGDEWFTMAYLYELRLRERL